MSDYIAEFELKKEPIEATFSMEITSLGTFNHNELLNRDMDDQHPISAITGLTEELNSLDDKINIEKIRAESEEEQLRNDLTSEINRATAREENLQQNIDNETLRAETEESRLDGKIDDEIVARTQDIADLSQELTNEVQRATNKENELSEKIDTVEDDLTEDIDSLTTIVENNYTTLDNRITEVASELEQTIEENVVALQNEDTALQNQINSHSTTLTAYDTRITNNANAITQEITDRQSADDNLQEQIDGITAGSDVKDIVGTYAELQAYDKSTLGDNDIIKVLQDETRENASTYYRYVSATQSFSYIGKEGPFYTKSETDTLLNAKQDTLVSGTNIKTLNNESLLGSGNIDITSAQWGNILGTLSNQTDLQTALDDKVGFADYPSGGNAGVIRTSGTYGTTASNNGYLNATVKTLEQYNSSGDNTFVGKGTLNNVLADYVKNTDYASASDTGVIKAYSGYSTAVDDRNGVLYCQTKSATAYDGLTANAFIGKGTLENIKEDLVTSIGDTKYQPIGEYATVEELASKQDKLTAGANITIENNVISSTGGSYTAGNGIDITDNKISTNTQFVITEDMFDLEFDDTKGEAPYNVSYGYTNITIHDDVGVEWVEGASYTFVINTKQSSSTYRNLRFRIGESGDWKPAMLTSSVISGAAVFAKAVNCMFFYKTTYQANGALHVLYDTNTTYTINYSIDAGQKKAGIGTYAVDRYTLIMQKPDMTWEKIVDTSKKYSTATTKTVNKRGFLLNQIRFYNYTAAYANGALIGATYVYEKSATVNASYSFNCGTAPGWEIGDYIYLVGTVKDDGLFYLDETKWWNNALPTTNDGKLYIQLGIALTTTDSTFSLYSNRPIYYHDGTSIREYIQADNKQDVITDLEDIRSNISTNTSNISYLDEKVRDIELFKFPNAVIIGEPSISNGQVSGFSANNYMQFPFILDLHNTPFQIDFAFTTGDNVTTQQNILDSEFGLALAVANGKGLMAISGNGTSWNIGSSVGSISIQPNTTYYARLSWDGMQYKTLISTNGTDYTQDMYLVGTQRPYPRTIFIGGCSGSAIGHTPHPFLGSINMNKAYLSTKGQVIWQGMDDAGLSTRADLSLSNLDELGEKRFTDKQDTLISGTNIKTINNESILGSGNIEIKSALPTYIEETETLKFGD